MTQSSGRLDRYFRHRRWYEALLWSAYFLGEATANSITVSMDFRREQLHFASWEAIVWEYSSCLTLLALVPGVLALERRFPFRFTGWRRSLAAHFLATLPFSLIHVGVMVALRKLGYVLAGKTYSFGASLSDNLQQLFYEYLKDCRTYAFILCCLYVYRFFILQLQGEARLLTTGEPFASSVAIDERPERFLVRKLGKEFLVAASEIEWLEAAGNYINLHVRGRVYPLRSTMAALEMRLDPNRFRRVHRSYMVNLDQLAEIEPLETGDARLKLRDGSVVPCSRRYRDSLRATAPVF